MSEQRQDVGAYRHRHREIIRWGDMDAFGHVNNVQFFRYLEGARVAYSREIIASILKAEGESIILADMRCSFRKQLTWPGELDIYTRTVRVGRTSIGLAQIICLAGEERIIATAESVIVWFDFNAQQPVPVPEVLRKRLADYERLRPDGL
ncbi:MAG: acyl-CoA thioesterase [Gammaproteobacteria bacterium]